MIIVPEAAVPVAHLAREDARVIGIVGAGQ